MAEQKLKLSGKIKWAKVTLETLDSKYGPPESNIQFYPDEASLVLLKQAGSRVEVKEDEEGRYVKLKRPFSRIFTDKTTKEPVQVELGLPAVGKGLNEDGTLIPYKGLIGNGSSVDVKVSLYDTKQYGKGTRLEAINITTLLEYTPDIGNKDPNELYKF
jgi:hypothetical protein